MGPPIARRLPLRPTDFFRLSRREQIRHLHFDRDPAGRILFMPFGASEAMFRLAYVVPSEELVEQLITRYSRWSRILFAALFTALLAATLLMIAVPDRVLELAGPHLWLLVGAVIVGGLLPNYLPGWIALKAEGPLERAFRSYRDVARHHDRVRVPTPALWAVFAVLVALLAAQGWITFRLLSKGHTGLAVVMGMFAALLIPIAGVAPMQARLRRLRAENDRLESVVRERTAELEELNRTLESRIVEQVRDIEKLGQLKHFFAAPVAEVILGDAGFDPGRIHRRELTVICVDLRGFTAFSETAEPEEVIAVLRVYHAELGILVNRHEATLEHFAGDGALIFLNDPVEVPDHPARGLRLASELRASMRPHIEGWRRDGFDLGMGAGVAMGHATIGAIGYEGRWEYAAIGNVCNLAARLCSEAKDGQVVTTQRVGARAGPGVTLAALGEITLKGFSRPVAAFDVVQGKTP
jgi:adenylate cyclase